MNIESRDFGTIDIDERDIIHFDEGIPGFEEFKSFVVIQSQEHWPFNFLQSTESVDVCFITINPFYAIKDYKMDIHDSELSKLGDIEEGCLEILSMVVLKGSLEKMTANLVAPILVNRNTHKGIQTPLKNVDDYKMKEPIFEALQKRIEEGDIGC